MRLSGWRANMALLAPQPCAEALVSAWEALVVVVRP